MTDRKVTNLLDSGGEVAVIDEGEGCDIVGTFKLGAVAVSAAAVQTVLATLFIESSGESINNRNAQDVHADNGGSFDDDDVFTLKLTALDNATHASTQEEDLEYHIIRLTWTWIDSDLDTRTGKMEGRFPVRKLKVVT